MGRDRILAELLLHDSVERDLDLQAQIDAARHAWIIRRAVFATIAIAVLLGLIGIAAPLLAWQVALVVGLPLTEAEVRVARAATSARV